MAAEDGQHRGQRPERRAGIAQEQLAGAHRKRAPGSLHDAGSRAPGSSRCRRRAPSVHRASGRCRRRPARRPASSSLAPAPPAAACDWKCFSNPAAATTPSARDAGSSMSCRGRAAAVIVRRPRSAFVLDHGLRALRLPRAPCGARALRTTPPAPARRRRRSARARRAAHRRNDRSRPAAHRGWRARCRATFPASPRRSA